MQPTRQGSIPGTARTRTDRGATSVEYAIMGSAVAAVIVVVVFALGEGTLGLFQSLLDVWP